MSYSNTFINVAPDCPISIGEIPESHRPITPIQILQYNLLIENLYKIKHKELVFEVFLQKNGFSNKSEKETIWNDLFSKGHPCLQVSALTKLYGFSAHYNRNNKIAVYPMESKFYMDIN